MSTGVILYCFSVYLTLFWAITSFNLINQTISSWFGHPSWLNQTHFAVFSPPNWLNQAAFSKNLPPNWLNQSWLTYFGGKFCLNPNRLTYFGGFFQQNPDRLTYFGSIFNKIQTGWHTLGASTCPLYSKRPHYLSKMPVMPPNHGTPPYEQQQWNPNNH